jgi:hypothetical protein
MQRIEKGPRSNGVLEGLTFNKDYSYTVEEPYTKTVPTTTTKGGLICVFKFDTKSRKTPPNMLIY